MWQNITKLTLFERKKEKESHYKEIEYYEHKYFSIKIYKSKRKLTVGKIKKIVDIIKAKKNKEKEEYQNLIIYIEDIY